MRWIHECRATTSTTFLAFLAVARERSFTRAAAKLGVSQSALSHTSADSKSGSGSALDPHDTQRLRPPRRASACFGPWAPRFDEIDAELVRAERASGEARRTIRITTGEHAAEAILWPALATLLPHYPDIKVELITDYGLTDIVTERYDAGVRLGEQVAKDMVAVRNRAGHAHGGRRRDCVLRKTGDAEEAAGPDGSRLHQHRLPTYGGLYAWEFEKRGRELKVRVDGQLVFQQQRPEAERGTGRDRPGVPARRPGADAPRRRTAHPGARRTGVRPFRAITSTTRSRRQPTPAFACWSTRCAIGLKGRCAMSAAGHSGLFGHVRDACWCQEIPTPTPFNFRTGLPAPIIAGSRTESPAGLSAAFSAPCQYWFGSPEVCQRGIA